ncbi:MAG: hypothetical protein M1834_009195 [Cirrosporium novae-zelandiae]|nr:MAG: hypothetical protein M1834_009195 [Cirrosporium novae-zelandiae]
MKYMVTLKSTASPEELQKAKDKAISEGGKITDEFTLIKGFAVDFPADAVHTLATNEHLNVEADQIVHTQ